MRVSLVVPCFQEAEAVLPFGDLLPRLSVDEVIFVDDGSTDATAERLRRLAAVDPRVLLRTHPSNRGVGAAMRTGLEAATGDVVVVYDADRTYPFQDVERLVEEVRAGADVATASPWGVGGSSLQVPLHRKAVSQAASLAYALVLGPRARSIGTFTCAFRAYRRTWVSRLDFRSDGFGAAAELLGLAILSGASVVEVPSRLAGRTEGTSKMRFLPALREHGRVLWRLGRRRLRGPRGPGGVTR